jgi:hypothetical protein
MSPVPNLVQVPAPAPATTLPSYGEELMQMIFVLGALVAFSMWRSAMPRHCGPDCQATHSKPPSPAACP